MTPYFHIAHIYKRTLPIESLWNVVCASCASLAFKLWSIFHTSHFIKWTLIQWNTVYGHSWRHQEPVEHLNTPNALSTTLWNRHRWKWFIGLHLDQSIWRLHFESKFTVLFFSSLQITWNKTFCSKFDIFIHISLWPRHHHNHPLAWNANTFTNKQLKYSCYVDGIC